MHAAALTLLSLLAADPQPKGAACSTELFRIARSKNANVVVYEAKSARSGGLDPDEPVTASWLMLAGKGGREGLNFLERAFAYGFDVRRASPGPGWALKLKALKGRGLQVLETDACPAAFASIGGQQGILRRIYVKTDEHGAVPKVEYVELFGESTSGAPLYEKILPGGH